MTMNHSPCTIWLAALALFSCVGTDHIADPPMAMPPRIEIRPAMAAVDVGSKLTMQADFFDDMGMRVDEAEFIWSSSDPAVATVTERGVVSGQSEGQVEVTASRDEVSVAALVGVVADRSNQVAMVHVSPENGVLRPGETLQLAAESLNADDEPLAGRTFTWSSSDTEVVTITEDGQATAVAPGRATIRAITEGIVGNSVVLIVLGEERSGMFVEAPDSGYTVEGIAALEPGAAGGLVLRLSDDFRVSRGPNLVLFLSTSKAVGPGSLEIAPLQGFGGAQEYPVPDHVGVTDFDWVIIHCAPFNVTFGYARLQ